MGKSKKSAVKWAKVAAGTVGEYGLFVGGPRAFVVNFEGAVGVWRDGAWVELPSLSAKGEKAFVQSAEGELLAYCDKKLMRLADDSKWKSAGKAGGPGARHGITLCAYGSGLLAFGGRRGGKPSAETWRFVDGAWTKGKTQGPPARASASAVAIDGGEAVLLFAGEGSKGAPLDDAWIYRGDTWAPVTEAGAGVRNVVCLPYLDADTHRVLGMPYGFEPPHHLSVWQGGRMVSGPSPLPKLAKGSYRFGVDLASRTLLAVNEPGSRTYALPLDEALEACAPSVDAAAGPQPPAKPRRLRAASTPKAIAGLEQRIGAELRPAIRELFATEVSGSRIVFDPGLQVPVDELYTATEAAREWSLMRDTPGVRWAERWVPIASDGAGNLHFADNSDGTVGYVCHDPPDVEFSELAPMAWLAQLRREGDDA